MTRRLRILYLSSEVAPFAKSGGLADVAAALPRALCSLGFDIKVGLPYYSFPGDGSSRATAGAELVGTTNVTVADTVAAADIYEDRLAGIVPVWRIRNARYFDRDGLYGDHDGDYGDNLERFVFFCRAALAWSASAGWIPDVVHCNDWQTALVPAMLRASRAPDLARTGTLFTVHNVAYQGIFPADTYPLTGLPSEWFNVRQAEYWGRMNAMKLGIVFADKISTVSPTYAREIQTPEFGFGLEGVFADRADDLVGILNGVDYDIWDPIHDPFIAQPYGPGDLAGKAKCKADLQGEMGLPPVLGAPLVGIVSRLVEQKGIDLVLAALDRLVAAGAQLAVLGQGERRFEDAFANAASRYPHAVAVRLGFDESMAHRIEAGADMFLMPSRFEPSGLSQLYSLRYGALPVVRKTGGLADSVVDATDEAIRDGTATGFVFEPYDADAMWSALARALALYRSRSVWERIVRNGMRADFSWARSAASYGEIYETIVRGRRGS